MMKKGSKPYYVPKKEELFNYVDDGYYEVTKEYDALQNYIKKHLIKDEDEAQELVEEIHGLCQFGADMKSIMNSFNDFNVNFKDMDQVNEVMQLVMGMANNIRIWENNGFTPNEIFEKFEKPNLRPLPDKPFEVKKEKIGRNDPCPCGSGKKYKKCCLGKVYH
ncbi:MAG TPA: nucleic acid-binding protein [Eubacteriaceae bacterium]|nr:nucleic acid-binding protein [Eubacteriaceae bacterium]